MGYRSLKVIQTGTIESLGHGAVSYSPSIVTMAVSLTVYEIFSVKKLLGQGLFKVIENGAVR